MNPVDAPSPDYVPYPEESKQAPLLPEYVLRLEYREYLAPSDEEVPVVDQPYAAADLPITLSPSYIVDLDSEEDPEDESEDGPTDYPTDVGDDDDYDDDSSGDDAEDEDEEEASEEDEEHLALTDFTAAASLVVDPIPSAEETDPFETDESTTTPPPPTPAYRTTTRMSVRAQTPIQFPSDAEVDRLLAIPTPPPSPLTLLSSLLPRIPSLPFPIPSLPTASPSYTEAPSGYRAAGIWLRTKSPLPLPLSSPLPLLPPIILPRTRASMVMMIDAAPSTYCLVPPSRTPPLLPIPLSTSSPPLLQPSTDCRENESSSAAAARSTKGFRADYSFVGTLDVGIRRDLYREIGYRITDVWEDPNKIAEEIPATDVVEYRCFYAHTARLMETEAKFSREAWAQSMDASDMARFEVQLVEALTLLRTLQTQIVAQQSQQKPDRDPAHFDKMPPRKAPKTRTTPATATATATTLMTDTAIRALISQGMADALAKHEIQRNNNLNGDGSKGSVSGIRRSVCPTSECTYSDFLKCQPMNFKGIEGVVKFATCTLYGVALTWWKSHVKIVGHDVAYDMPWNKLMKMITAKAYTAGPSEKMDYGGSLPKCSKCNYHHNGPCTSKCHKCNKVGHLAYDCKSSNNANIGNNQRTTSANQRDNVCYECGAQGHFKRESPKLKNNNHGNQGGNGNALAKVYVVGNVGTNLDFNVITGNKKEHEEHLKVGDRFVLKVSPWKGVVHFGKRRKLNPRYVGPFKVLAIVRSVNYKLELPQKLSRVQNTFHVSNLKKCYSDEPLAVPFDGIHIDDKLHFVEEPVEIMDQEVKQLKRSRISIIKVRWNSRRGPEFTWEREDQFQKKYPHIFTKTVPSSSIAP
nr:putative reverse transcriptase domain-containing protein [Tanacetum cinerariifolium]